MKSSSASLLFVLIVVVIVLVGVVRVSSSDNRDEIHGQQRHGHHQSSGVSSDDLEREGRKKQVAGGEPAFKAKAGKVSPSTEHLNRKISIPNLPTDHYIYWLRNDLPAQKRFERICQQVKSQSGALLSNSPDSIVSISDIFKSNLIDVSSLLANLTFDDPHYAKRATTVLEEVCERIESVQSHCWGYEVQGCDKLFLRPECPGPSQGWTANKFDQLKTWFNQADFGYVKERRAELKMYCKPQDSKSAKSHSSKSTKSQSSKPENGSSKQEKVSLTSSLECTKFTRFCRGTNIYIDFRKLRYLEEPIRYRDDVLKPGQIGGFNCDFDRKGLMAEGDHRSPLQSWFAEVENFVELKATDKCDLTIDKPVILMKLDATVNLYHHFCDFVNLYASIHLNNSFSDDVQIIIWDTIPYRSNFGDTWSAFTRHPIQDLSQYAGKRVCFKRLMLPLLPRMIYGLYYNMPLIPGCQQSGLFKAFNQHILHRLAIPVEQPSDKNKIRVTFISRITKFRQVLNEQDLVARLRQNPDFEVTVAKFTHTTPFKTQLSTMANTDILIGMHGAGLTHTLFLPDWGVIFELFNCEDPDCYKDLARLRGVKYLTWERSNKLYPEDEGHHPELGAHKKFTNYKFDPVEFERLVMVGAQHVREHRPKQDSSSSPTIPANQTASSSKVGINNPISDQNEKLSRDSVKKSNPPSESHSNDALYQNAQVKPNSDPIHLATNDDDHRSSLLKAQLDSIDEHSEL